jgi:flagellar hook protein FlgE
MSLYGMMRTGTAGMNSQASRLGTVADNIANANTTGYKKAKTEFSTLVLPATAGAYNSGSITPNVRYGISEQGALEFTSSSTDLAISGDGFFVVEDATGQPFLTRAGSFTPDGDGFLVNAAGYKLLGADYTNGSPVPVVNGFDGLVPVNVSSQGLTAIASTSGTFTANLDDRADAVTVAANLPSANDATAEYTSKSSLVAYDDKGAEVLLDFYYTKTGANTWEVSVFDKATGAATTSFPYTSPALATATLDFESTSGSLTGASASSIAFTVPGGSAMTVDLSDMTELAYEFSVSKGTVNGQPPNATTSVEISADGTVYANYANGELDPIFRIAMADVPSPDKLKPVSGNVYTQGVDSGVVITGFAGSNGFGTIQSGALEGSNVDIAEELTTMIESQRSYTANSKVFQTGSDLMDVLVNLKR